MVPPEPILVSVNEAAAMLRLSRSMFYKLLNSGALSAVKSGKRTLVPTQALRDYANSLLAYAPRACDGPKAESGPAAAATTVESRILRIDAVMARTGLKRTSIYTRAAAGKFPSRISLGGRASGWRESDVDAWIADPANYRAKP